LIRTRQHLRVRKEDVYGTKNELPWERPKVLVNRTPSRRGYWRNVGAADYVQLVASERFLGVWPRADAPPELLASVISGLVVNAYEFAREDKRHHRVEVLANAPVPNFTPE